MDVVSLPLSLSLCASFPFPTLHPFQQKSARRHHDLQDFSAEKQGEDDTSCHHHRCLRAGDEPRRGGKKQKVERNLLEFAVVGGIASPHVEEGSLEKHRPTVRERVERSVESFPSVSCDCEYCTRCTVALRRGNAQLSVVCLVTHDTFNILQFTVYILND